MSDPPVRRIVGVDIGNTSCTVAVMRQGTLQAIANEQGNRSTPCCVAITEVETIVGEAALGQISRNPRNTIVDLMLMLGRDWDDAELQAALPRWRFGASRSESGQVQVELPGKNGPQQLSAGRLLSFVLSDVRVAAEAFCDGPVKEAVIAVPAHHNERQTQALLEAARSAGMRVKELLSQPLAVALLGADELRLAAPVKPAAEAADTEPADASAERTDLFLVVDVGGSSTSVSVVQRCVGGDGDEDFALLASRSTLGLGGAALDAKLRAHVLRDIKRRSRIDLSDNARVMGRLLAACEACKRSLSSTAQAQVAIEAEGADYFCNVTRAVLDDISASFCQSVIALVHATVAEAKLAPAQLRALLLAGGGARSPALQAALAAALPGKTLLFAANCEEAVAKGVALHGAMLAGHTQADGAVQTSELAKRKLLPRALCIELAGGALSVLAQARSPLPLTRTAQIAKPPAGGALHLSLSELTPAGRAWEEAGEAPPPPPASRHEVCSLAVREVTEDAATLTLRLSVEADGSLELSCEAAFDATEDDTQKPPLTVASVRAPAPSGPAA